MRGLTAATGTYVLSPLRYHEAESLHVMREVAAEFERLVLLSSLAGGSAGQTPLRVTRVRPAAPLSRHRPVSTASPRAP